MTKNKIAYALIAAFAIGLTTTSLAVAEPMHDKFFQFGVAPTAGVHIASSIPDIKGSVDIGKDIISNVKVGFAEASAIAESEGKGTIINGNLGVQNGFLVYTFSVLSENEMKMMIIDAGDGKILHTSEPIPAEASSLLLSGGHAMFFKSAMPAAIELSDGTNIEE
ncbi:MAG: hypothetical protein HZC29_03380 [Thaumarchaeota archaeon]|nr:hypothetical protein [Nitrososphaerota archaeon]